MKQSIVTHAAAVALFGASTQLLAGGFAIGTQSGSGTGNAFAGGAAAAEDASTVWYNPAGMSYLPAGKHAAIVGHALKPSFKFRNGASTGAFAAPGTGDGGDGGDWAVVPQAYFSTDLGAGLALGAAFNVPFGLKTHYDSGWRGQLTALKSELKTYNLNAALSYKITNSIAIAAGVSWQKLEAELSNSAGAAGVAKVELDDDSWGMNFGVMYSPSPETRIGAHYRSSLDYKLTGSATFSGSAALNGSTSADLRVPESVSLSFFSAVSPRWDIMGDITWTRWSRLEELSIVRTSLAPGAVLSRLTLRWDDTWRVSIGANYKPNAEWKFRFGLAYDPTPTHDADRTPRLPDQDRFWVATGVQYRLSKTSTLDIGYAHEFIRDANVNVPVPGFASCAAGCLNGKFENKVDIFSVQWSLAF